MPTISIEVIDTEGKVNDMAKHLKCTDCGLIYDDEESIEFALKEKDNFERVCKEEGIKPKGICPCPVIPCKGDLALYET